MWKLVIEDDEGKRTVVPLTRDDYTIGRKEGNTIRLTERNVSRAHAKLLRKRANGPGSPTQYALEDLTSYNGVYVNGLRVATAQDLIHGDLIQIGDYRMVLQDDQVVEVPVAVPSISADAKTTIPAGLPKRGVTLMERPNRLVMLAGPTPGTEYALDRERLTVGRAEDATISVNHNSVSRLHCEIHLLGEGRYEIVDKGSSNGVRVNSAELKRGIVEAGDIIELGDVKFKFVGAGQIFLPGVNDSQKLAAIADRAVPAEGPRRSSTFMMALLGAVVALAIAALVWTAFPRKIQDLQPTSKPPVITSETPPSKEQGVLDAARALAAKGDFEGAHTKLALEIPEGSPLRQSPEFIGIETHWTQDQFTKADAETEITAKRTILGRIASDPLLKTDHPSRVRATEMLAQLDAKPAPTLASAPVAIVPSGQPTTSPTAARPDPAPVPPPPPRKPPPTAVTATTTTAVTPRPVTRGTTEVARQALLDGKAAEVKALLMPLVSSGKASDEDRNMLRAACQALGDRACTESLKAR